VEKVFELLLKSKPEALQRVCPIAGDCLDFDLGISGAVQLPAQPAVFAWDSEARSRTWNWQGISYGLSSARILSLPGLALPIFDGIHHTLHAIQELLSRRLLQLGNLARVLGVVGIVLLQLLNGLLGTSRGGHGDCAVRRQRVIQENAKKQFLGACHFLTSHQKLYN